MLSIRLKEKVFGDIIADIERDNFAAFTTEDSNLITNLGTGDDLILIEEDEHEELTGHMVKGSVACINANSPGIKPGYAIIAIECIDTLDWS